MSDALPPFVADFNAEVREAEVFLCITRDSGLQRDACESLAGLRKRVASEKAQAIDRKDEDYANLLLGCEFIVNTLTSELQMWLALKDEEPDQAWDHLISAQSASALAMRVHDGFRHLEQRIRRLEAIERLVFPPQVFVSTGTVINILECSICGQEYEDCDHLAGRPYMGELCYLIVRDMDIDHVAIVERPADKRCRALGIKVEGGTRNRMTWRVEPDEASPASQA